MYLSWESDSGPEKGPLMLHISISLDKFVIIVFRKTNLYKMGGGGARMDEILRKSPLPV